MRVSLIRQRLGIVVTGLLMSWGCGASGATDAGVKPLYDDKTGKLAQLQYDSNADGVTDVRVVMDGNRPLRAEVDANQDGKTERWEYFGATGRIERVGTSSADNGREDTWTHMSPEGKVLKIERTAKDGKAISRREFYAAGVLGRVEEDTDQDGRLDKWETYEHGAVAVLALDTTRTRGKPDRRLVYGPGGTLRRIEADPDGDGIFAFIASPPQPEAAAPK